LVDFLQFRFTIMRHSRATLKNFKFKMLEMSQFKPKEKV
jgi:hypothetical protein